MAIKINDFSQFIELKKTIDQARRLKKNDADEAVVKLSKKELEQQITEAFFQGRKEDVVDLIGKGAPWFKVRVNGQSLFELIVADAPFFEEIFQTYPPGKNPSCWPRPHRDSPGLFADIPPTLMKAWIQSDPTFSKDLLGGIKSYELQRCVEFSNFKWFQEEVFNSLEPNVLSAAKTVSDAWKTLLSNTNRWSPGWLQLEALKVKTVQRKALLAQHGLWKSVSPEALMPLLKKTDHWDRIVSTPLADDSAKEWLVSACEKFFKDDNKGHWNEGKDGWVKVVATQKNFNHPDTPAQKFLGLSKEILSITPMERFMAAYVVHKYPHVEEGMSTLGDLEFSQAMVEQIKLFKWAKDVFEGPSWRAVIGYMQRWGEDLRWPANPTSFSGPVLLDQLWSNQVVPSSLNWVELTKFMLQRATSEASRKHYCQKDKLLGPGSAARLLGMEELKKACKDKGYDMEEVIKKLSPKGVAMYEKKVLQKTLAPRASKIKTPAKKRL